MAKKQDNHGFELGEVVMHKVDDRKMVIIAFTYPVTTTTATSYFTVAAPGTVYKRKGKAKPAKVIPQESTGVRVRTRDMHGDLVEKQFTFHEIRKKSNA